MAKEAYYFSHDANARTDPKILQMRSVYKSEGYGWYWMLIEKMREEANYTLSMQGKYVWNAFALEMDATAERIKEFVEDCICEFKLFESDGTNFWSKSLLERMKYREIKSEKARQSAEARWKRKNESQENQGSERSECDSNANASKNDAIKESKRKEIKENKREDIIPIILTAEENEFIEILKSIENYPLDLAKDREMFNTLKDKYAVLDMVEAAKTWAIYKIDKPLEKKSNPRSQINTSFSNYVKWGKCLKGDVSKNGGYKDNNQPNYSYYDNQEYTGPIYDDSEFI